MYTKLFSSILTSSIWNEDDKTRIMWITFLAAADRHGEIMGSVPGMARLAGMSVGEAETAIGKLSGPDPYSRTPTEEGRRIMSIPGGWEIINYVSYREKASREDQKAKATERVRRWRARNGKALHGNERALQSGECNASVTHALHIAEAEADTDTEIQSKRGRCAVFTRQSKPERRNSAPAPAPDEGFGEFVNGGDLAKAHDWVAGMFGSPCLSALEREAMAENARAFLALSDADRRAVEVFQRVPRDRLDKAAAWHRPDKCLFWLRDFPEVLRSARRWTSKNGNGTRLTEAEILRSKGIGV